MTDKTLDRRRWTRRRCWHGRRQRRRARRRERLPVPGARAGQEAHLLGRADLLGRRQQAAGRHHQRLGRRQRRRDRSGDDQPERDHAEGLGRGRLQHHAGRARSRLDLLLLLSRQSVFSTVDDLYAKIGEAQGGWYDGVAARDRHDRDRRRPHRHPVRRQRQPAAPPQGPARARRLHRSAHDLGGAGGAGGRGQQAAGLRPRPRALQCRRRQRAGRACCSPTAAASPTTRARRSPSSPKRPGPISTWVKDAWDKGIFPPGNTTWDGAGDNQAYLSGQAAFIANTGSVGIAAKNDDPELFEGSAFSPLPGRPKGVSLADHAEPARDPQGQRERRTRRKALIEHLAQPRVHERLLQRRRSTGRC